MPFRSVTGYSVLSAMKFNIRERQLVLLLFSILLVLIVFPYVEGSLFTDMLLNVLQAVIVVSCIVVVSTDRKHFLLAFALGCLSLFSGWVPRSQESVVPFVMASIGAVAFYVFAIVMICGYVLEEDDVTLDRLAGALCAYMLIAFLWAEAYDLFEIFIRTRSSQVRTSITDKSGPIFFTSVSLRSRAQDMAILRQAQRRRARRQCLNR